MYGSMNIRTMNVRTFIVRTMNVQTMNVRPFINFAEITEMIILNP